MDKEARRSTVYFDPEIYNALRVKATFSNRSMSDLVNEAVKNYLREDEEDLAAFEERVNEPVISCEAFLKQLKANGKL